jgi:hypothetical protein
MTDWHYSDNGGKIGPVTTDELKFMFQRGKISPDTLVWNGSFGADWRKFSEVSDLYGSDTPPPLPVAQINEFWLWVLALVPLLGFLGEVAFLEGLNPHWGLIALAYLGINCFLIRKDENSIRSSGRTWRLSGVWTGFLVPVYLFGRNRRLQKNQLPLVVWLAALFLPYFVQNGFTMPYLGLGAPGCSSSTSIEKVKEIFPDLPVNFAKLPALEVKNISETGKAGGKTNCRADIITNNGAAFPATFTIEERSDGYYYWLQLAL